MNKEEPIRIAHIIGKWVGGGVEAVVMNYYMNIDRNKIQFDFICDNDSTNIPYDEIKSLGGKVILIPPYQKVLKYHKELKRVLKDGNYKIVHSHINTLSVFSLWAAKSAGVPIRIAHSHSTTNKKEKKKNLLKQILRPFSKIFATDYMCCSELSGRWLFGNKEYDEGNVFLLNNAIDLNKFKYDEKIRKQKRKELNIKDDTLVIGHIGRFVEQKNHRFLIDIFNEIHKKNNNSILLLTGQGPLVEEINKKVIDLELDNSVIFLGQRKDVNELYQVYDVFLLPSLYEGLPVVGIEAQATGNLCFLSEDMTKETKILNSTVFMSLDNSAEKWANKILENVKKHQKHDTNEEITKCGFNIKQEVNKLEEYYLEKEKQKIMFYCYSLAAGGAERVISTLANKMVSDYSVEIDMLVNEEIAYTLDAKIKLWYPLKIENQSNLKNKIINSLKIIKYSNKIKPQYIISFCPTMCFVACFSKIFNYKLRKTKLIISERNNPSSEYKSFIMKKLANFLYSKADVIVFQTNDAMKFFNQKVQSKGVIIYNPINENFIKNSKKSYDLVGSIVSVGRLENQKNHQLLINSFSNIVKKYPNYILKIYGVGSLRDDLEKFCKEKGIANNVFFLGKSKFLYKELINNDIFVLSSDYEGMPNALMEAMALGLPCISTDCPCGGPKEIIKNMKNGILIEVGNSEALTESMELLIKNDEIRKSIGNEGKKIANKCNSDAIIKEWKQLLK